MPQKWEWQMPGWQMQHNQNLHLTENFYTDMSVVSVTNMRYGRGFFFTFFYETAPISDISTRQICDSGHKFVILCCKFCQNITLTGSTHCIQRLTFANKAYNYSIVTFVTLRPVATNTL